LNLKQIILLILLSLSGSCVIAAPIIVSGLITDNGVPVRNQWVHINAPGADTSFMTGPGGNYNVVVNPSTAIGTMRVFFLCKNDTTDSIVGFDSSTRVLTVNLNGCVPVTGSVTVTGNISNSHLSSSLIRVYFSQNNFRSLFDSTLADSTGFFSHQFTSSGPGTLYTRIVDCDGQTSADSTWFNLNDSISQSLDYCPVKMHVGMIYNSGRLVSPTDAILLNYKYLPEKEGFQFDDTLKILSNGTFQFVNDKKTDYLLKVIPKDTAIGFAPTYYPNGIQWDNSNSKAVGPHTQGVLRIDLNLFTRKLGAYSIRGTVKIDPDLIKDGYSAVGIHLLDTNNQVIDFTFADRFNDFYFNNLNEGQYKIWIDQCGIPTNPKVVNLSRTNPTVSDVVLTANPLGISYDEFVGVEPVVTDTEPALFPNPFDEILNLKIKESSMISVHNMQGKLIREEEFTEGELHRIETKEWQSGVYVITIQNKKELYRKKVIKR